MSPNEAPRPSLLTLGMGFTALWSGIGGPLYLWLLLSSGGRFEISEELVSKGELLRHPVMLLFPISILYAGALAWVLHCDRSWSRELMMAFWITYVVAHALIPMATIEDRIVSALFAIILAGIAGWYLYWKADVVAYYARTRESGG